MKLLTLKVWLGLGLAVWVAVCSQALPWDSVWTLAERSEVGVTDQCLVERIPVASVVDCAARCLRRLDCLSFFFTRTANLCQLHSNVFDSTPGVSYSKNSTSWPETSYFYNIHWKVSNFSHIQSGQCMPSRCNGYRYVESTGRYWKLIEDDVTSWDAASVACQKDGGQLASPRNQAMVNAIEGIVLANLGDNISVKGFYVFAKYKPEVNGYVWIEDGSLVDSTLWDSGQPTRLSSRDCVVTVPLHKFKFYPYHCNVTGWTVLPLCDCH